MTLSDLQKKNKLTDEETIDIAVKQMGMSYVDARFMLAMEKGIVKGDVVVGGMDTSKPKSGNKKT